MDDNEKMVTSEDEDNLSSSDEEEKQLENRAADLEKQIVDNKYLYDVHIELVDLYHKLGDLKSMRAAYERFANHFPLTSSIWLNWIRNEIKLANSPTEKKYVISLFDKAVEDYLSVDIWLEYVQFCIGNCKPEETYEVLERGLTAIGLNTNQGSLLWDALREFELAQLPLHKELSEEWQKQINKVADAFRRELCVPLLGMENIYVEWQQWLEQLPSGHEIDPKLVEWGYQKALKLLAVYKPFEDSLINAKDDETIFSVYQDYINTVTDPATILCLYERAVAQLSLNSILWYKYCSYTFKLGSISYNVSKRALRNCPWSEELWIMHLRILEQEKCSDTEVTQCLEQGLGAIIPSPGLNLWLSYVEYIRRLESPERLHKIIAQASNQLGETGDPTCKILRLQARLYSHQGDMEKARRVWSKILHYPSHKNAATAWLEYASLEKQYGDANHLRILYQRALSSCTDWPQYIAEDWLMYERERGTLKDVFECEEKCSHIVKVIINEELNSDNVTKPAATRKRGHDSNADRGSTTKRQKTFERSKQIAPKPKTLVSDIDSAKSIFVSNMREDINEDKLQECFPTATAICIPTDRNGSSRCFAYIQFADQEEVQKALNRDREPLDGRPLFISKCELDQTQRKTVFKYSTNSEDNKLFVRGLPINFSKEDVEGIFKTHGAIAVRLVTQRSGRSKGLAYIEFSDQEKAKEALKATDQLQVAGHTITVAVSAPPPKKSNFNLEASNSNPIRHARTQLQIPFIPRSVQTKSTEVSSQGAGKTNADFRKLFNKT